MSEPREASESPEKVSRARALMERTSGRQRLGVGVAVALLLTAPFGGLKAAETPDPVTLKPGRSSRSGPTT